MADHPDPGALNDGGRTVLLERILLVLLFGGLFIGVVAIVRPFLTAILFGASGVLFLVRLGRTRRRVRRGSPAAADT